jgi:hypothetical protein
LNPDPNFAGEETMLSLASLINNATPLWTKYILGNVITQVRLRLDVTMDDNALHIVIKEHCAPEWMKRKTHPRVIPDGYLASLGLDSLVWDVTFGVDYS